MTPVGLTSRILYPFISRLDTKQLSPPSPPHTARSPPQAPFIQESTFQTECENFSSGTFHRRLNDSFYYNFLFQSLEGASGRFLEAPFDMILRCANTLEGVRALSTISVSDIFTFSTLGRS